MFLSDRIDTSASCTSGTQRVISSNRSSPPARIATIVGEGMRLCGVGPSAITRAMFHEYLMCSSVVPAVPWMTRVELPLMAAARCSLSQLLPVPGSPTSSRARSEARVTMARSTIAGVAEELAGDLDLLLLAADRRVERLAAGDVGQHGPRRQPPRRGRLVGVVLAEGFELVGEDDLRRQAQGLVILRPAGLSGFGWGVGLLCHGNAPSSGVGSAGHSAEHSALGQKAVRGPPGHPLCTGPCHSSLAPCSEPPLF